MRALPLLIALAPALPAAAEPPAWTVVPAQSRIGFAGTHAGTAFTGAFGQWTATIRFDPADLAHSSANVTIATASGKTGDTFRDTALGQDEWFDPAHFPRATFVTRTITAAGPGRYVADGVLTIKGKALPAKLPFQLQVNGTTARMTGRTSVDRIAYNMGAKSDPSAQWVSRPITLTLQVTAHR